MAGLKDKTIFNIAEDIGSSDSMVKLGLELDIPQAQVDNYVKTNHAGGQVSSRGTVNMLFAWKVSVPGAEQRQKLGNALVAAGFTEIAEEHLSLK